jgi:PAS domain S-box-containing protein
MGIPQGRSIRVLLATLILALVVPFTGLVLYFGIAAYRSEKQRAEERLLGVADAATAGIHQFLEDSRLLLEGLAEDTHVTSLDPEECSGHFGELGTMLTPTYTNLASWSREGRPVCSILPSPEGGLDMSGAPGFAEALASETTGLTPVQRGRRSGRWSTQLTHPLRDASGTRTGMLSLSIDLVRFRDILLGMSLPERSLVSLTELDGTVVARSIDSERWVGQKPPSADARSEDDPTFSVRGFSRARTFDGSDFSWGFVRVPDTDWLVYAGIPTEEVYGNVWAGRVRWILLTTLVLGGAFFLGWNVYVRLARPLEALVEGIARATPTKVANLPTDGPSEIAWVAERFNRAWAAQAHAERERERSDERIRSLVENAVTGMCVVTSAGRFLEVNRALADILAFSSQEDLLATPLQEVYPTPQDRRSPLEVVARLPEFRGIPATLMRQDGVLVEVRLSGRRVEHKDSEVVWEVIVEDVTELTRLQTQSLQAQKMEALGRLAGGVAHDFNNILTIVQGQADLLREDDRLDEGHREQAEEMYHATLRAAALNRQLLAFGRRSPGDRRPMSLNDIVRGFELVLRRAAGDEVAVRIELAADLAPVLVDRSQMEQVLMNLVVNARDAMPGGGTLRLATHEEVFDPGEASGDLSKGAGRYVVLSVTDSGSGIPEEVLPHIFEPFYSTKSDTKGTGLGLATVYGIVTDSGGHIWVASPPGAGTTVRVFLPALVGAIVDGPPAPSTSEPPAGSGLILLVEDEEGVRRLAGTFLERGGYEVIAAADGPEALRIARARGGTFDLLVTDIVMPGMKGHEVAKELAEAGSIRRALFVSGYPEGFDKVGVTDRLEAWAFLAKPFSGRDLLRAVGELLGAPST